jgi:hypothetical protein
MYGKLVSEITLRQNEREESMKRKLVIVVLAAALLFGAVSQAGAEVRLDFDIPVLLAAGLNISSLTGNASFNVDISGLHIPLPYIELAYQFGGGFLRGGFGLRTYTALVQFVGWPMGYIELQMEGLVLRGELGGFAFFLLGLQNNLFVNDYTLRVLIPDVQLSYAFAPWFRAGMGILAATPLGNFDNFGYLFYINARFVLEFK